MKNFKNNILTYLKRKVLSKRDRYPKLFVIIYFIRNFQRKEFQDYIINRHKYLKIDKLGDLNQNVVFYYIEINQGGMGFGAYFRWTLHAMYDACKLNAIPIIKFGDKCPYRDNLDSTLYSSPYDYYFKQVGNFQLNDVLRSKNVLFFRGINLYRIDKELGLIKNNNDLTTGYENISENYLKVMGEIVKKYISLNNNTKKFIDDSIKTTFPKDWKYKKILAVHVRGTDFALHWDQHPNIVQTDDFFNAIDIALERENFQYIFLATDDSIRLEMFKNRYKEKLLYFKDVHRSSAKVNVSFEKIDRPYSNYLNGLEVLRDMYTMAYCNGFIAGLSQVSVSARIINRSLNKQFEYEKIIDKGIYNI